MTEPERRLRRRPAVSCSVCRRRKIRCNRETPCSNCLRSREAVCVYENFSSQPPRQRADGGKAADLAPARKAPEPQHPISFGQASSISSGSAVPTGDSLAGKSTPGSQGSVWDVESMKGRIRELEEQLSKLAQSHPIQSPPPLSNLNIETFSSSLSGTIHVHHESRIPGEARLISRSFMQKTRLFGQSHWINGVVAAVDILHLIEILEPRDREDIRQASSTLLKCKNLAKAIKAQRAPPWPTPPSPNLPSKEVTDKLVDCYLRTVERVYRVIHIPTFRRDYDTLWVAGSEPDAPFLVQLKLVLAIGAATYDEQFSLRTSAIRWIYEGQTWLADPDFKSKLLSIQSLQTNILLVLAREAAGIGEESNWISAGGLLRLAVYMGLHKDPVSLPRKSTFYSEMRRRIWNTVLEISLQSSITSGGPPLISLGDFDAEAPGNFDDDQIMVENPVPKPAGDHTDISVAIALRKTFPVRLAIAKFINDLGSNGTYEETLRLDEEFRNSFKALRRTLQENDASMRSSPPGFEIRVVELIMYRYLLALHLPFFSPSLRGINYAFSRKVAIETSLKVWCAAYPSSSVLATQPRDDVTSLEQDDLTRLTICGSGFFRIITTQASFVATAEIRDQLQEEGGLSPVPLRSDLLAILRETKSRALQCVEAGETNVKGYLIHSLLLTQIQAIMDGVDKEDVTDVLVKCMGDVGEKCLSILEAKVARATVDELDQVSLGTPSQLLEDWDFMMTDAQFDFPGMEPTSWMFNEETAQGLSIL